MEDWLDKCQVCRGLIDEEDLFCANCGRSTPDSEQKPTSFEQGTSTYHFECQSCGASMSFDATSGSLRCPFCGSTGMQRKEDQRVLKPKRVVRFRVGRQDAEREFRQWLGRGFWRPGDLIRKSIVEKITMVYVPYWVFSADTLTYWTADSGNVPVGARSNWYPVSGDHRGHYEGLLVGASSALSPQETDVLCPFDLDEGVPPEEVDLDPVTVEQFTVPRKYARPIARQLLERLEHQSCQRKYLSRGSRKLQVNVRLARLSSYPVLLPVWIMAYRYRGDIYRFLLNGQTGKATGRAPLSWFKITGAIGLVLIIIAIFLLIQFLALR